MNSERSNTPPFEVTLDVYAEATDDKKKEAFQQQEGKIKIS